MVTGDQLFAHLIGDYILQNDWMANNKDKNSGAAFLHAVSYSIPFLFLNIIYVSWLFIVVTHYFIDRYRLAKYVIWFKNGMHEPVTRTGYKDDVPVWMSTWLFIIVDNTMHIACNGVALGIL